MVLQNGRCTYSDNGCGAPGASRRAVNALASSPGPKASVNRDAGERPHGHARSRREDVAVALAVDFDEPLVIAARGDGTTNEIDARHDIMRTTRMLDTDAPWCSVGMRAEDADIAAEIDEPVAK